jgi:hypothetical protein
MIPPHDGVELDDAASLRKGYADHDLRRKREGVGRLDEHAPLREILGSADAGLGRPSLPEFDGDVDRAAREATILDHLRSLSGSVSMVALADIEQRALRG